MAVTRFHNLPASLSNFIGRQQEIADVVQRLASHRLVTLTGPGGCGKTRLAIEAAHEMLSEFEGGVWLTEFAPLADGALVPRAVAASLGVAEQPGRPLVESLVDRLRHHRTLLVLDNCEHLVAAAAQLAESLVKACPDLHILATSREPLNVSGEVVFDVPPLSLPELQPWRNPASRQEALPIYEQSEAVQLFTLRAEAASPSFTLTDENAAWAAEICRRLDGMPLAIELAAARVRTLSVRQIARFLDDRFHLLTLGNRTSPPRHQTLEATLDWSYDLLTAEEQKVLQRLSVFAGGWTLEAAEAVCVGEEVEAGTVLDELSHLLDKSFVVVEKLEGEARFKMLETIREYAKGRLSEFGETSLIRKKHAETFLRLAQRLLRSEYLFFWPVQIATVNLLEVEHDNFRAALDWCRSEAGEHEIGLRLASALGQFWQMRGYLLEGLEWLETLLSINKETSPAARAKALSHAGHLRIYAGEIERAKAVINESLVLFQELDDKSGIAWQQIWLAWANLAQRDFSGVNSLARPAFAMQQELGDDFGASVALAPLGEMEYLQGNLEQAKAIFEESLALAQEAGALYTVGRRLTRLGQIAHVENDLGQATALIREGLMVCLNSGDYSGVTMAMAALASIVKQTESRKAAKLLGAVSTLREVTGTAMWYFDLIEYERTLSGVRSLLDEERFNQALMEGRDMSLEEAIKYALESSVQQSRITVTRQAAKQAFSELTAREREVAALLAGGKSNREIAEAMTVRVKTVETYVTRILNKLGFDSRVQVAVWAVEKGLGPPGGGGEDSA